MKTLLLLSISLILIGCKKAPTDEEKDRASSSIETQGRILGLKEYTLEQTKSAGEVALLVEKIRDQKDEVLKTREVNKDVIPMEESAGIAERARCGAYEESKGSMLALKIEIDKRKRDTKERLAEIEMRSKREQAESDLDYHRKLAELKLKLSKDRLDLARIDAGQDPESFRPPPQAKPSSDPNLPPGMERKDKAALEPIEIGED